MTDWHNDPTIRAETNVYRRIRRAEVVWDDSRKRWRPSSVAFQHFELSVALEDTLREAARVPADALPVLMAEYPYLVALTAGFVRQHDQLVVRDPDDDEPAHGLVVGDKMHPGRRRKDFASAAAWEVEPLEGAPPPGRNRLPDS